jgi:Fe-S cluster biogenesis protein NfuA
MMMTEEEHEFRKRMERLESLIQEIDRIGDPAARALMKELVQTLLDYHGAGLARMLEVIAQAEASGQSLIETLSRDDLVGSLLLLYGLHPLDLEARVRRALEKVRPYLQSHGGNVELIGTAGGAVRLRMQGSCNGCPSSVLTLKNAIEEAVYEAAPDVTAMEVEGVVEPSAQVDAGGARVALPILKG